MKRFLLLPFVLLTVMVVKSQHGYLGARNVVSVGINDRLWSDAWSLSFLRALSQTGAVRLDARILSVDRDLPFAGAGWLGLRDDKTVGTVTGNGFGFGIHYSQSAGGGLGQPLGYYMSIGLEYTSGTTTEKLDPQLVSSYVDPYGTGPVYEFDYEHRAVRLVYDWGIRKVLADRYSLDLGMELGYVMYHTIKTEDDLKGAGYALGFERNALLRFGDNYDPDIGFTSTESNKGFSITLTPMARFGVLF